MNLYIILTTNFIEKQLMRNIYLWKFNELIANSKQMKFEPKEPWRIVVESS